MDQEPPQAPSIRRLTILRFRGIEKLTWYPSEKLNVILGGGDVGKTTVLDAIALLLSPSNATTLSDADFWKREGENGFEIEAVMSLPASCGISQQKKPSWPWDWDGKEPKLPATEEGDSEDAKDPVYRVSVKANSEFDLSYEVHQPDGSLDHFGVSVRRAIGLVRLGGDDRNDRDLRLVQGSALDRLLSDKSLRARLGQQLSAHDVKEELKQEGKDRLVDLDKTFAKKALPQKLGLALTPGQGFSVGALIGLTAERLSVQLPLASWGAGTRRLSSLEIAAASHGECPIMLVDEIERGLEPYRQRGLINRLQALPSQVFITTHSPVAVNAATQASVWYLDASGTIGSLERRKIAAQQKRDPEAFLARICIVAEGVTEKGFVRAVLARAFPDALHDRGICITDAQGHDSCIELLEALSDGGVKFGGFVDNEGRFPERWKALKAKNGNLLFQWKAGCIESNLIGAMEEKDLYALIEDPEGEKTGDRLRTLADRLGIDDKSYGAIAAAAKNRLRDVIVAAATGKVPDDKASASEAEKKHLKGHARHWFKSFDGGEELVAKMYRFGLDKALAAQLLPFVNAVREAEKLDALTELP